VLIFGALLYSGANSFAPLKPFRSKGNNLKENPFGKMPGFIWAS